MPEEQFNTFFRPLNDPIKGLAKAASNHSGISVEDWESSIRDTVWQMWVKHQRSNRTFNPS